MKKTHEDVLKAHGYHKITFHKNHGNIYGKSVGSEHHTVLTGAGSWVHYSSEGHQGEGHDGDGLHKHLSKVHKKDLETRGRDGMYEAAKEVASQHAFGTVGHALERHFPDFPKNAIRDSQHAEQTPIDIPNVPLPFLGGTPTLGGTVQFREEPSQHAEAFDGFRQHLEEHGMGEGNDEASEKTHVIGKHYGGKGDRARKEFAAHVSDHGGALGHGWDKQSGTAHFILPRDQVGKFHAGAKQHLELKHGIHYHVQD